MTPSRTFFFYFSEELKKDVTFMFNYINFIGKYIIEQVCILMTIQDLHVGSRLILEKCERIFHSISLLFFSRKWQDWLHLLTVSHLCVRSVSWPNHRRYINYIEFCYHLGSLVNFIISFSHFNFSLNYKLNLARMIYSWSKYIW